MAVGLSLRRRRARRRVDPAVPCHQLSTAHHAHLLPPAGALPDAGGPVLGQNLHDLTLLRFDPFALYGAQHVSSPNRLVISDVGAGKSSLVKTLDLRLAAQGRRVVVMDVKGEWPPVVELAERLGIRTSTLRLERGGRDRLNPLDVAGGLGQERAHAQRVGLLAALAGASGAPPGPVGRACLAEAVREAARRAATPTVASVVDLLLEPTGGQAQALRTDRASAAAEGREVGLALSGLVRGDLAGMLDGPTSGHVDLSAPLVVVDLSSVYDTPAQVPVMVCAGQFLLAELARQAGAAQTLVEVEESWALLRHPATALFFVGLAKLSRAYGLSLGVIVHRLSDLEAAGAEGSEQVRLARGLISEAQIQFVGRQGSDALGRTADLLGLTAAERDQVSRITRRGDWLLRVGGRSGMVRHVRAPVEVAATDTDWMLTGAGR